MGNRETSKTLAWVTVFLSSVLALTVLVLAFISGEFSTAIVTTVCGMWSLTITANYGFYVHRAKAKDEFQSPPELTQAKEELATLTVSHDRLTEENKSLRDRIISALQTPHS